MKNVSCSRTVTLTSNRLNTYLYRNAPARDPVSRRPARTRPTRAQTRERILDGALEAFAERGFHGSTQEDICERVGLSRGAYNSSFRSKDELFFALYDRVIERLQSRLEEATACALSMPGSTADNFLKAFIAAIRSIGTGICSRPSSASMPYAILPWRATMPNGKDGSSPSSRARSPTSFARTPASLPGASRASRD